MIFHHILIRLSVRCMLVQDPNTDMYGGPAPLSEALPRKLKELAEA